MFPIKNSIPKIRFKEFKIMSNMIMFGLNLPGTHQLSVWRDTASPLTLKWYCTGSSLWISLLWGSYVSKKTLYGNEGYCLQSRFWANAGNKASVSHVELQEENKRWNNLLISLACHPLSSVSMLKTCIYIYMSCHLQTPPNSHLASCFLWMFSKVESVQIRK